MSRRFTGLTVSFLSVEGGDKMPRVAQRDLRRVTRAAQAADRARSELVAAIVQARAAGETFRDIGSAAGLSHTRVQQLIREAKS